MAKRITHTVRSIIVRTPRSWTDSGLITDEDEEALNECLGIIDSNLHKLLGDLKAAYPDMRFEVA